jgi:3-methyladenine DNA glycosylase Tag
MTVNIKKAISSASSHLNPLSLSSESAKVQTWLSKPRTYSQIKEIQELKVREKFSKMNNKSYSFSLAFFKHLVETCETSDVFLDIPETIVVGYGFHSPCLLYNDEKGLVRCLRDLSSLHIKCLIDLFEAYRVNNYRETFGPLAILRNQDSQYNRILMKPGEIVLEWKNAYKVDVILQRFIISKGTKASKFRIAVQGNEVKVFRIVNQARHDLNQAEKNKETVQNRNKVSFVFNETSDFRRFSRGSESFQDLSRNRGESSFLQAKNEFNRSTTKHTTSDKLQRKSILLSTPLIQTTTYKRTIPTLKDYLKSCYPSKCFKSIEECKKDLKNCRYSDHDFHINPDEMIYVSYYREKITELFNVSGKKNSDIFEIKSQNKQRNALKMIKTIEKIMNSVVLKPENLEISKIVCDFIEDGFHNIYFSKIKSFETVHVNVLMKKVPIEKVFKCPGKFCRSDGLTRVEAFEVLKKRLKKDSDENLTSLNSKDFERVKVCQDCYQKYAKNPVMRKKNKEILDISFPKMEKNEISNILNQINPSTASQTCIVIPKKLFIKKKIENPLLIHLKSSEKIRKNGTAQEFFRAKLKEIEKASFFCI